MSETNEISARYNRMCELKNPLDDSRIEFFMRKHYAALNFQWKSSEKFLSLKAAWDARDAWDAWDAWDARAAWAARDARAAWDAWDACYLSGISVGAAEIGVGSNAVLSTWFPVLEAAESGLWMYWYTEQGFKWIPQPTVVTEVATDNRKRLHCATGPAFILPEESLWFYKGVFVTQQIVEKPETLTHEQIIKESNAEVRRVMIERFGLDRFLSSPQSKTLHTDQDGRRQLLRFDLTGDEPIVGVKVTCPTTGQVYFLRVPPQIDRCDKAVAWSFGYDKVRDYQPQVET